MKRSKEYIVTLRPQTWAQTNHGYRKFNPGTVRYDVLCGLQLAAQHQEEPLFNKPVRMEVTFLFPVSKDQKKKPKPGDLHTSNPYLTNLFNFLIKIMEDTIITKPSVITELDVKKLYAKVPMTKILIKEL